MLISLVKSVDLKEIFFRSVVWNSDKCIEKQTFLFWRSDVYRDPKYHTLNNLLTLGKMYFLYWRAAATAILIQGLN